MANQAQLVHALYAGLIGSNGNYSGKRLEGGRVIFRPSSMASEYASIYSSPTISNDSLIDQSAGNGSNFFQGGVPLDIRGCATVYGVGSYFCEVYDHDNVKQLIDFRLSYGTTGDSRFIDVLEQYGASGSNIQSAIDYANSNPTLTYVFLFKGAHFNLLNDMVFPPNVSIEVKSSARLVMNSGTLTVTINGYINAGIHQIFQYSNNLTGVITLDPKYNDSVYPQWFGAIPDGTTDCQFAISRALGTGIKRLVLSGGDFKVNTNIIIPNTVEVIRKGGADFLPNTGVTVTGLGGQATVFDKVQADGSLITNLNGANIASGTVNDDRLSNTITKEGNSFNGANQLVKLDANQKLPARDGSQLTNLTAENIETGIVDDARLSNNITKQGNVFNGANQLVELDSSQKFPAKDGSQITTINGSNISSGTVNDDRLSNSITKKGNNFNGANQLVQLDANQKFPAKNASLVTDINGSNVSSGTVADARLSNNVTKKGNTFNGASQLVQLDSSQRFPAKNGSQITSINGSNVSSGTVADTRLSTNITKQGNIFNGANQLVKLDSNQRATVPGGIDSGGNGTFLKTKIIAIGAWNMLATDYIDIQHDINIHNIVSVNVLIRKDSGEGGGPQVYPLNYWVPHYYTSSSHYPGYWYLSSTIIRLYSGNWGSFNNSYYNSTSISRGWVTLGYVD